MGNTQGKSYHKGDYLDKPIKTSNGADTIIKLPSLGSNHRDTQYFDDAKELQSFAESPFQCRIVKLRLWYGKHTPTGVVNGIQLTYKNIENNTLYETKKRYGDHQLTGYHDYILGENEYLKDVEIKAGAVIDKICFLTNKKRVISEGGEGGSSTTYKSDVIIGTHGGFGGHLHNIGFYVAPIEEYRYWKRRSYLQMRTQLRKNKDIANIIVNSVRGSDYDPKNISEMAFAYLAIKEGGQIFIKVMLYI